MGNFILNLRLVLDGDTLDNDFEGISSILAGGIYTDDDGGAIMAYDAWEINTAYIGSLTPTPTFDYWLICAHAGL